MTDAAVLDHDLAGADELSDLDRNALKRCMAAARKQSAGRSQQLDGLLKQGESWVEVASFAATCVQSRALELAPWEICPCDADVMVWQDGKRVVRRDVKAGALADRLIEAGLSIYEPDPAAALRAKAGR